MRRRDRAVPSLPDTNPVLSRFMQRSYDSRRKVAGYTTLRTQKLRGRGAHAQRLRAVLGNAPNGLISPRRALPQRIRPRVQTTRRGTACCLGREGAADGQWRGRWWSRSSVNGAHPGPPSTERLLRPGCHVNPASLRAPCVAPVACRPVDWPLQGGRTMRVDSEGGSSRPCARFSASSSAPVTHWVPF